MQISDSNGRLDRAGSSSSPRDSGAIFWSLRGRSLDSVGRSDSYPVSYEDARKLQLALVELRAKDLIPDIFLFLEHAPVVTRGRGLQFTGVPREKHMPLIAPLPSSISFFESERGGDLTYHGPGQLVFYPVCKLDGKGFAPNHDIAGFLRRVEKSVIGVLGDLGLAAESAPSATGVWTNGKKIASMGIAIKKWVSYHGLALNCVNDLQPFQLISPCGFSPEVMTRLADWVALPGEWRRVLENSFVRWIQSFSRDSGESSCKVRELTLDEAFAWVEAAESAGLARS